MKNACGGFPNRLALQGDALCRLSVQRQAEVWRTRGENNCKLAAPQCGKHVAMVHSNDFAEHNSSATQPLCKGAQKDAVQTTDCASGLSCSPSSATVAAAPPQATRTTARGPTEKTRAQLNFWQLLSLPAQSRLTQCSIHGMGVDRDARMRKQTIVFQWEREESETWAHLRRQGND